MTLKYQSLFLVALTSLVIRLVPVLTIQVRAFGISEQSPVVPDR